MQSYIKSNIIIKQWTKKDDQEEYQRKKEVSS